MLEWKWIALILLVFSYVCGTGLNMARASSMTSLEFSLYVLSNHYYLLYFFLIIYLVMIIRGIRQLQLHELIRYGRKSSFMIGKFASIFSFTFILVFLHFITAMLVGLLNLPASFGFSEVTALNVDSDLMSLFFKFKETFSSPLPAIAAVCLYLVLGLSVLAMVLWKIALSYRNRTAVLSVVVIIVNVMIGFKLELSSYLYPLFINKYILFHHNQFQHGWRGVFLLLLIELVVLLLLLAGRRAKGPLISVFDKFLNNRRNYSITMVFLLLFFGLRLLSFKASGAGGSSIDFFLSLHLGMPFDEADLKEFLSYVIYMGFPIYFIARFEEFTASYQSAPWVIRHCSRCESNLGILLSETKFLMVYFFTGLFVSILLSLSVTGVSNGEIASLLGTGVQELIRLLMASVVFRLLELLFIHGAFRLGMGIFGKTVPAFIVSLSGYVLLLFGIAVPKAFPYGLSSVIRLSVIYQKGYSGLFLTGIILAVLIAAVQFLNILKSGGKLPWKK